MVVGARSLRLRLLICAAVPAALFGSVGAVQASVAPATSGSSAQDTRIIGGEEVTDQSKNPGAVGVHAMPGMFRCSGVRVGPTWVLTARHCAEAPKEVPGATNARLVDVYTDSVTPGKGVKAKVKKTYNAPLGDQMLLELAEATAGPVAGWSDQPMVKGDKVEFYGWGSTSARSMDTRGLNPAKVLKKGYGTFEESKATELPSWGGLDDLIRCDNGCPWHGDSGGPAFRNGKVVSDLSWSRMGEKPKPENLCAYIGLNQNADWFKKTTGIQPNATSYYLTEEAAQRYNVEHGLR